MTDKINQNKIVLFSKQSGETSFSSLWTIKHALNTTKVGHTGTLDSFASGLLVVCAGSLTRLASRITEFDKSYLAVIEFGKETDTLECTGNVTETAPLPEKEAFFKAFSKFTGEIKQTPPVFSAIHIDGKRASDMARSGKSVEIPSRMVHVFSSEVKDIFFDENGLVKAALVFFDVSKGTYIRSLARDIAIECGSKGHLVALRRTRVGNFLLKDAAGISSLENFTIENAYLNKEKIISNKNKEIEKNKRFSDEEISLQKEVVEKSVEMSEEVSNQCGFGILHLKPEMEEWFDNGRKLSSKMFDVSPFEIKENFAAVFTENKRFAGLLQKDENGYFKYSFVQHDK